MKRRNEMAHISVILAELLSGLGMVEPEAEAAVNAPRPGPRNNRDETVVRYEFETADRASSGEAGNLRSAQDEPAHLLDSVRGLTPTSKGKSGKMASTEAPAKFHGKRQTEGSREVIAISASPNTMSGSITVAHRRRRKEVPASGAAVIDLGMYRARRHAATSF